MLMGLLVYSILDVKKVQLRSGRWERLNNQKMGLFLCDQPCVEGLFSGDIVNGFWRDEKVYAEISQTLFKMLSE